MIQHASFRPLVAAWLAVGGLVWVVVFVRAAFALKTASDVGATEVPTTSSEELAQFGFFVVASFGGALAVWIGHRRSLGRGHGDPGLADPTGIYLGAFLFGCLSFAGAVCMLFAPELVERFFG
ncbi:MAG: hypothetical protein L6Q99_03650 [Planctomycetes bacterium]|nr:hypothetical protein [Planctomycetota bacterium]